jgi:hypothetical protein
MKLFFKYGFHCVEKKGPRRLFFPFLINLFLLFQKIVKNFSFRRLKQKRLKTKKDGSPFFKMTETKKGVSPFLRGVSPFLKEEKWCPPSFKQVKINIEDVSLREELDKRNGLALEKFIISLIPAQMTFKDWTARQSRPHEHEKKYVNPEGCLHQVLARTLGTAKRKAKRYHSMYCLNMPGSLYISRTPSSCKRRRVEKSLSPPKGKEEQKKEKEWDIFVCLETYKVFERGLEKAWAHRNGRSFLCLKEQVVETDLDALYFSNASSLFRKTKEEEEQPKKRKMNRTCQHQLTDHADLDYLRMHALEEHSVECLETRLDHLVKQEELLYKALPSFLAKRVMHFLSISSNLNQGPQAPGLNSKKRKREEDRLLV